MKEIRLTIKNGQDGLITMSQMPEDFKITLDIILGKDVSKLGGKSTKTVAKALRIALAKLTSNPEHNKKVHELAGKADVENPRDSVNVVGSMISTCLPVLDDYPKGKFGVEIIDPVAIREAKDEAIRAEREKRDQARRDDEKAKAEAKAKREAEVKESNKKKLNDQKDDVPTDK